MYDKKPKRFNKLRDKINSMQMKKQKIKTKKMANDYIFCLQSIFEKKNLYHFLKH